MRCFTLRRAAARGECYPVLPDGFDNAPIFLRLAERRIVRDDQHSAGDGPTRNRVSEKQVFRSLGPAIYGLTTIASIPIRDTRMGDALLAVTDKVDASLLMTSVTWRVWHCLIELRKVKRSNVIRLVD